MELKFDGSQSKAAFFACISVKLAWYAVCSDALYGSLRTSFNNFFIIKSSPEMDRHVDVSVDDIALPHYIALP